MLLQDKSVAIVGGGPGGLTLARLLQLEGVQVTVYERDVNKDARVQGSPLDLHDESGLAAIEKAGLLSIFKTSFLPGADRKKIMNEQAEVSLSDHEGKPEENFGAAHFRPEISRGTLRKILLESLAPGTVSWNSHFVSMEPQGQGWLLHFKHTASAYADIVIAADGANSKIRPYLTPIRAFYTGITMLEGNIDNADVLAPHVSALLQGGKIMAFGNEKSLLMGQKGASEIGFYASFKTDENWVTATGLDFSNREQVLQWFRQTYSEWNPVWEELFTSAPTPFIPRPIYCMPLDQHWQTLPNLTMLGDAAHVMPPFAGEGVNMAMRDALELSDALTRAHYADITSALAAYESSMLKRAAIMAKESLDNGELMHGDHALAAMLELFKGHEALAG